MAKKYGVAEPNEYPKVPAHGYYAETFKKGDAERELHKTLKEEWKVLINAEYGHILPRHLLKKVNNPSNYRLTS